MNYLNLRNLDIKLPIFLPDATRGVVRSLDSDDLMRAGVDGVVVNTYHLMSEPGIEVIKQVDGIKKLMGFPGLVISDSGGFQLLSLIYRDAKLGKVTDEGVTFYLSTTGERKKYFLSPEKSIEIQFDLGADILICLDDCPPKETDKKQLKQSVEQTIVWAKRCKEEFERQVKKRRLGKNRPWLFAVIQGGKDKNLRKYCAEELIKIGFDGYGFGGWPMGDNRKVDLKTLHYVAKLMPDDLPKYALGVGDPKSIVECFKMGYTIFDCVLPTRDARHKRLYVFSEDPNQAKSLEDIEVEFLYFNRQVFAADNNPISGFCDCFTCQNYSRAYLRHLLKIGDSLAWRLATIHNLRTYTKVIEILRHA